MITFHPLVHLLPHSVPQTSQATLPPVAGDCFPTVPPNSSLSTNKHHYHLFSSLDSPLVSPSRFNLIHPTAVLRWLHPPGKSPLPQATT